MRWLVFVIFFIVFSVSSFASPIDVEFEREYYRGETAQGKLFIGGDVQDELKPNDFRLELDGIPTGIFPTLIEFEDYTYFFFNLPLETYGNYSFIIEDLVYLKNGVLTEEDLLFNFTVLDTNESVVNINPAVINLNLLESNYFYLDVSIPSGLEANVNIVVEDDFITPNKDSFVVDLWGSENVEFYVSSVLADKEETSIVVEYGNLSYTIDVFLENFNVQVVSNETNETNVGELNILEETLDIEIEYGASDEGFIRIINEFEDTLEGIEIEVSRGLEDILELEFYEIASLNVGEVEKNRVYVNEIGTLEEGEYVGSINVLHGDEIYDTISVHIEVLGIDGPGNVTPPNPPDNGDEGDSRWTIIIAIGLFLVVVGGFVLIKYLKSKKKEAIASPWTR